jgi:hypothetical protein
MRYNSTFLGGMLTQKQLVLLLGTLYFEPESLCLSNWVQV